MAKSKSRPQTARDRIADNTARTADACQQLTTADAEAVESFEPRVSIDIKIDHGWYVGRHQFNATEAEARDMIDRIHRMFDVLLAAGDPTIPTVFALPEDRRRRRSKRSR